MNSTSSVGCYVFKFYKLPFAATEKNVITFKLQGNLIYLHSDKHDLLSLLAPSCSVVLTAQTILIANTQPREYLSTQGFSVSNEQIKIACYLFSIFLL